MAFFVSQQKAKNMKITITTDRRPWANDAAQPNGAVIDTDAETAKRLIELGFAEKGEKKETDTGASEG